ncbi:hypothetical protein E4T56_gene17100, partial [Termitomyces sp. T112]
MGGCRRGGQGQGSGQRGQTARHECPAAQLHRILTHGRAPSIVGVARFKPGADRPSGLLAKGVAKGGHIDFAIAARPMLETLDEPFIARIAQFKIAQIRRDPARNCIQTMAARAILAKGRFAD